MNRRQLFLTCLLFFSFVAHAWSMKDILNRYYDGEKCIDSRKLEYVIARKFDEHHYEMVVEYPNHAILETNKTTFFSTGHPIGVRMEYIGVKTMKLDNGFSTPR